VSGQFPPIPRGEGFPQSRREGVNKISASNWLNKPHLYLPLPPGNRPREKNQAFFHRLIILFLLPVLLLSLSACLSVYTPSPSPLSTQTLTPSPTIPSTPTIVWFPPTATFTPFPTQIITPTQDLRPGLGSIILTDDFYTSTLWTLNVTPQGRIALGKNELTIALSAPKTYLYSLRKEPVLSDFYIEITASPNLCQGLDEYGLLLRVSPAMGYYRFSLSCNGQVRLDRVAGGQASSPQPWMMSGAFPPGAPSSSRLAAWLVGNELRFFVNDYYQFTIRDPLLKSGGIGIFARSTTDHALTINFSNLVIREIAY